MKQILETLIIAIALTFIFWLVISHGVRVEFYSKKWHKTITHKIMIGGLDNDEPFYSVDSSDTGYSVIPSYYPYTKNY